MDRESGVLWLSVGLWVLVFVVGAILLSYGKNVFSASGSLSTLELQVSGVSLAWAISSTGFGISVIAFAELLRMIHSRFLSKKVDDILRRLPPVQSQAQTQIAPGAALNASASSADIGIQLELSPLGRWYRMSKLLRFGHVVVGESYNILVRVRNLRVTSLPTFAANLRITISINGQQTPFNTSVTWGSIGSNSLVELKSAASFLIRQISQGDLEVLNAYTDGGNTGLRMLYQGQPSDSYLTSYEVEPRKAISDRAATIIQLVFGTSFIAIILQLLGLKIL